MEALLEGNAGNRAHFAATENGRLSKLMLLDSSDLFVLTDAKQSGLAACCRVVLALRESAAAVLGLSETLQRLALERLPSSCVRALACWALAQLGAPLSDAAAARAAEVALLASPAEAAAACALVAAQLRGGRAVLLASQTEPGSAVARLRRAAAQEERGGACWWACHALAALVTNAAAAEALLASAPELLLALAGSAGTAATTTTMNSVARLRLMFCWVRTGKKEGLSL
jgi:hypothetical protein